MPSARKLMLSLVFLAIAVVVPAHRASADVTEIFYVSGTFTSLLGKTETLAANSSVNIDLTTGTIVGGDLVLPGASFTGTPTDILNSYTWSYTKSLSFYSLTLDVPPLLANNLVDFNGGSAIGALTLPLPFGVSGSDTLNLTPTPEPTNAILFATGLLAALGAVRRQSGRRTWQRWSCE